MSIKDFIGQKAIIERFMEQFRSGMPSHAYVLSGQTGIGKKILAREMAKLLLCMGERGEAPCEKCRSCRSFDAESNPSFFRIVPKTRNILIDQIRVILDDIMVRPAQGRKVYLIEEADRMTTQAQNCLLKTLEEPPPYAVIIMTANNFESLLITIRSRVVHYKLGRYSDEEIRMILEKHGKNASNNAAAIAYSEGIPAKAIDITGNESFLMTRDLVFKFLFADSDKELVSCDLNLYLSKKKEALPICLDVLESAYRDVLVIQCGKTTNLINSDKRDKLMEYAQKKSMKDVIVGIDSVNNTRSQLKRYINHQLAVDMVTLVP